MFPSAVPVSSLVLLALRCTAGVAYVLFPIARKPHGACDRLGAHAVFPLVSDVF